MAQVDIPEPQTIRRRTRTYDAKRDNNQIVFDLLAQLAVPAGTYIPTALDAEPEGDVWKLCNGQALLKEDFPRLYEVFGGQFGETDTTFNLPDLRGRMVMGVNPDLALGAQAGQSEVTLTVDQMPSHSHTINDPGHTHAFTGSPHGHSLTDPGHSHAVTDPGHTHSVDQTGATDAATGADEATVESGGTSGSSTTGISVNSASTGISVDEATAGGSNADSQTGVSAESTGGGQPVDITPPVIGVNWLVRT